MKTYKIEPAGSSKIEASLCAFCQPGQIGEELVRKGCSQSQFSLFIAKLAKYQFIDKKNDEKAVAHLFDLVSACNASAAKQALAKCQLYSEEARRDFAPNNVHDKEGNLLPIDVETYWKSIGGAKPSTDLSKFL